MKIRKIVLVGCIVLLAVFLFVVCYYRGTSSETASEMDEYIPFEEILSVHEGRIKEQVELLKKQSLDKTFMSLLDDQQYFYPGYQTEVMFTPMDMEKIPEYQRVSKSIPAVRCVVA